MRLSHKTNNCKFNNNIQDAKMFDQFCMPRKKTSCTLNLICDVHYSQDLIPHDFIIGICDFLLTYTNHGIQVLTLYVFASS